MGLILIPDSTTNMFRQHFLFSKIQNGGRGGERTRVNVSTFSASMFYFPQLQDGGYGGERKINFGGRRASRVRVRGEKGLEGAG